MTNRDLLKEAIADAKAVKETAIANAKAALEEAFGSRMKEMLAVKLAEMDNEDENLEEAEETYSMEEEEIMKEAYSVEEEETMEEAYSMDEEKMDEEVDLEELLRELESMEENINLTDFPDKPGEHGNVAGQNVTEAEEMGEEGEEEEIDLENMSEDDLKSFIESVISDMVEAGELEAGHEGEEGEEEEEEGEEEELNENEALNENLNLSSWRVLTGPGGMIFQIQSPNKGKGTIDARVNKAGMVVLDGEREEGLQAIKQIAQQLGVPTKNVYSDGLSVTIPKSDFNSIFPGTLREVKMAEEGELEEVKKELKEALNTITIIKSELNEVNLFNAKLLYTNKIFKAKNLTEAQKVKVLTAFDKAASVKEAKLVFETLSEGFKEKKSPVNESLLRGSASKPAGIAEKKPILEVDNQFARWQKLAGIKN
jgi:hypothetical protein